MSRFKELRRIEAAIKNRDAKDLKWAEGYCQLRVSYALRKDHSKYWQKLLNRVRLATEASSR